MLSVNFTVNFCFDCLSGLALKVWALACTVAAGIAFEASRGRYCLPSSASWANIEQLCSFFNCPRVMPI